ncbi:MAG: ATP-binding protein [Verrucomicrobiota bacterium]
MERSFFQANRFSADAAHELKTPLTILQGKIDQGLSEARDGSPEQQNYESLLEEILRLRSIIGKLLLLSQADSGHLEITRTRFSLSWLLNVLIEDLDIIAPGIRVEEDVEPDVMIEADEELLYQAFQNLIRNAIKYNLEEDGFIRIGLETSDDRVLCSIGNSARPIPEEKQARLFDRFFRVNDAHDRGVDGTGLGLSLSREILHAHGGDIELVQSDEVETRFLVTLPG